MGVEVRIATAGDVDAVAAVAGRTFSLACPPTASPADIAAFVDAHLSPERFGEYVADPRRRVVVAQLEGATVGYAMLVLGDPADAEVAAQLTTRPTAELSKIYVDPAHHGAGAARALLDASLELARDAGAHAVWLGTNQANVRAQRFYEKSGFSRVGVKRFRLGTSWEDDFVYELGLKTASAPGA